MKKLLPILLTFALFSCTAPENKVIAKVLDQKITQGEFDSEVIKLIRFRGYKTD